MRPASAQMDHPTDPDADDARPARGQPLAAGGGKATALGGGRGLPGLSVGLDGTEGVRALQW